MSEPLIRIKRLILANRYRFTEKATIGKIDQEPDGSDTFYVLVSSKRSAYNEEHQK
jgi:hypothetical protein